MSTALFRRTSESSYPWVMSPACHQHRGTDEHRRAHTGKQFVEPGGEGAYTLKEMSSHQRCSTLLPRLDTVVLKDGFYRWHCDTYVEDTGWWEWHFHPEVPLKLSESTPATKPRGPSVAPGRRSGDP